MPAVNRIRRNDVLILLVILFAAALMRLAEPGIVEFKLDEAWLTRLARGFAEGGPLPLTGMPSSVGIPNPPASVYIMALPFAVTSNPVHATMFVAALNVIGVGLLWLLAHRYLGRTVALVAGLAYALNPWAAYYSRKIWAQDLLTPFLLAALLLGTYGFLEGKRWAQIVCLPLLVFALQIHFAALVLLPLYLWLLWVGRRRVWWPGIALSAVLTSLVLAPYIAGITQSNRELSAMLSTVGQGDETELGDTALLTLVRFATGIGLENEVAPETTDQLMTAVPPYPALWTLLGMAALTGLPLIGTRRYRTLAGLVALWVGLPLLAFMLEWTDVYPHYFIASIPALCLLTGVALDWLMRMLPAQPLSRTIILTAFAAVVLTQFIWWRGLLRYVALGEADGFGTTLGALMPLRNKLMAEDQVVLITRDPQLDYSTPPAIWHAILAGDDRCFAAISGEDIVVYPPAGFTVLVAPDAGDITITSYQSTGSTDDATITANSGYRLDSGVSAIQPFSPPWLDAGPARFANGVTLTGYAFNDGIMALRWQTPGPREAPFQYFVHVLSADGERTAQYDGPFLDGRYWCADNTVVTRQRIAVPADSAILRVGMYRLIDGGFANADLVDEAGNSIAPWFDISITAGERQQR